MINGYCSNTDCNESYMPKLYKLELKSDFDNTICYWCSDCIKRDKDMIENILQYHTGFPMIIDFLLNNKFDIR